MAGRAKSKQLSDTIHPVYVVYGKDRRRAVDRLEKVVEHVLGQADPQMALNNYDGPEAVLSEVLDDLRTAPFLSPRRVVVVKDADPFITEYRGQLEKYMEEPSPTGVLVMLAESFPSNTRLAKSVKAKGEVLSFDPVKAGDLPAYLAQYAMETHQLRLDRQAAVMLIELAGDNSGMLLSEIDKIAAYIGRAAQKNGSITRTEVAELVGNNRQYDVFNVINAMTGADTAAALNQLEKMLSQNRDAEYSAVGAFAWHFRKLYRARLLLEGGTAERAIIQQLRIWPRSTQEQFIRQVKRMAIRRIAGSLKELMRIDLASKTGVGTVRTSLEKFIIQF